MTKRFDILVVGGGMVGASLARALGLLGWQVGVIEAHPLESSAQPSFDDRAIALAEGSRRILAGLGVWPAIAAAAAPIRHIHVSDRGRLGVTRLHAREEGVDALGHVVTNRVIGRALADALAGQANVTWICPARLESMTAAEDGVRAGVRHADGSTERLDSALLVGADGRESRVRALAGLDGERRDYGQTAILANVHVGRPRPDMAFERFTPDGPLAFLPLGGDRYATVWTARAADAGTVTALDDADFAEALGARFGHRLGCIHSPGRRVAYPLERLLLDRFHGRRVLLLGNAVHSLHPVAGQGFNLCLRDVAAVAEHLGPAAPGRDAGEPGWLADYAAGRRPDYRRVVRFTEGLVDLFSTALPGLGPLRGAGLLALDALPAARHRLARQAMGLAGPATRLGLGLAPAGSIDTGRDGHGTV